MARAESPHPIHASSRARMARAQVLLSFRYSRYFHDCLSRALGCAFPEPHRGAFARSSGFTRRSGCAGFRYSGSGGSGFRSRAGARRTCPARGCRGGGFAAFTGCRGSWRRCFGPCGRFCHASMITPVVGRCHTKASFRLVFAMRCNMQTDMISVHPGAIPPHTRAQCAAVLPWIQAAVWGSRPRDF